MLCIKNLLNVFALSAVMFGAGTTVATIALPYLLTANATPTTVAQGLKQLEGQLKYPNKKNQINLSGNWNTKEIPESNGFTFSNKGCTDGFNGEITTTINGQSSKKRTVLKLEQEGNKLIFPVVTNTYQSSTSSGSFKIYKSGFVSENKVQIENTAITDTGGTVTILSIGIISDDGNTIKGKTTCKYSEGEATAGYDFIWERISNLEQYEVRLRLFIPSPALKVLASDIPCGLINAFCVFGGDNRRFSYDAPSHKYIANAIVTTDLKSTSPIIGKPFRDFCPTTKYLRSQSFTSLGKPDWWLNLKPGTKPLETKKLELDSKVNNLNSVSAEFVPGEPKTIKVSFKVSGSNPLISIAPPFNADINVYIQNQLGKKPLVRVEGTHDGFPGYEVYVNRQFVYGYDPEKKGGSPTSLLGEADITISKPWTQWSFINNKYSEQKLPSCENSSNFDGFGGGSSGGGGASGKY